MTKMETWNLQLREAYEFELIVDGKKVDFVKDLTGFSKPYTSEFWRIFESPVSGRNKELVINKLFRPITETSEAILVNDAYEIATPSLIMRFLDPGFELDLTPLSKDIWLHYFRFKDSPEMHSLRKQAAGATITPRILENLRLIEMKGNTK